MDGPKATMHHLHLLILKMFLLLDQVMIEKGKKIQRKIRENFIFSIF